MRPLINDLVIQEHLCNMKCKYCLTKSSEFEKEGNNHPNGIHQYCNNSILKNNLDTISDVLFTTFDIGILKISGGEVLLIKGIEDYIIREAAKYKTVQLLTNGILLNKEVLDRLKNLKNFCIQISLDHNEMEGNQYRTSNQHILDCILSNIDYVVQLKIPLEINCVLTDKNTGTLMTFLDYLLKYDFKLMVLPFPIRGNDKDVFLPLKEQLCEIENIIDNYETYKGILPCKPYLEELLLFMKNGKRRYPCYFPNISVGSFDDGEITPCSNYWFVSLGNLLNTNYKLAIDKIGKDRIYKVLTGNHRKHTICEQCFTPWELINLYFAGVISIDELCAEPLYSNHDIREYFMNFKTKLQ